MHDSRIRMFRGYIIWCNIYVSSKPAESAHIFPVTISMVGICVQSCCDHHVYGD